MLPYGSAPLSSFDPLLPYATTLQVRFNPVDADLLASGSLDLTVIVWRVSTGQALFRRDFGGWCLREPAARRGPRARLHRNSWGAMGTCAAAAALPTAVTRDRARCDTAPAYLLPPLACMVGFVVCDRCRQAHCLSGLRPAGLFPGGVRGAQGTARGVPNTRKDTRRRARTRRPAVVFWARSTCSPAEMQVLHLRPEHGPATHGCLPPCNLPPPQQPSASAPAAQQPPQRR
jgi:hypothetical protein